MRYLLRMTSLNTSAQPRDVDMAFWLWVASLLVSLIGQLFGLSATVDGLQDSMQERSTQPLSPDALASMVIFLRNCQSSFHQAFAGDGNSVSTATSPNNTPARTLAPDCRNGDLRENID